MTDATLVQKIQEYDDFDAYTPHSKDADQILVGKRIGSYNLNTNNPEKVKYLAQFIAENQGLDAPEYSFTTNGRTSQVTFYETNMVLLPQLDVVDEAPLQQDRLTVQHPAGMQFEADTLEVANNIKSPQVRSADAGKQLLGYVAEGNNRIRYVTRS